MSAALEVLERLNQELSQEFHAGTRITNCVRHSVLAWSDRPRDCLLCVSDVQNQLAFAIRVNEWLNARVEACKTILAALKEKT
jgi:hypothetical protein